MTIIDQLGQFGVVPVVKLEAAADGPKLAEALLRGGLPCAEITFRTAAAAEAIELMCAAQPEMIVGAGTVLSIQQADLAATAGARFIVSPGFDPQVVDWCVRRNLPVIPGIATPTEALMGIERGLKVLKFFPCEALGGIPMLEAISAALPGVKFVPTGGISASNLTDYLQLPIVHAVGGSWLATSRMIAAGDFVGIERLASQAAALVRGARPEGVAA
jgi:2-dehydro-3-deoxyphosphogluconate aldolase/(4S)-4-hydroxy-2-oxoglutarate aldolase